MDSASITRQEIDLLARRAQLGRDAIMQESLAPHQRREPPTFTARRAADLIGRSRQTTSRAIQDMGLGSTEGEDHSIRYSLTQQDIWKLVERFEGVAEHSREAVVVACINQKGGVAKSTTTVHLAHYCSLMGLRTLAIDADSQASLTAYMGVSPDVEVEEEGTLFPILTGDHLDLEKLIRPAPHFDRLDFVPACLALAPANELAYSRQYRKRYTEELAAKHGFKYEKDDFLFYDRLLLSIDLIRDQYDVIIVDCPPHITASTYNVIYAADLALVPFSASIMDIASTLRFIDWVDEIAPMLPGLVLSRIKFLATNYDGQLASTEALNLMRSILGVSMLKSATVRSTEVQRAGGQLRSIYELSQPLGSRDAWTRACTSMDEVNREILTVIEDIWATRQGPLKKGSQSKGGLK